MDRTRELEEQIRTLSATIEEMRGRLARLEGGEERPASDARSSRRGFLRLGGAAAAGAIGLAAARVLPVAAANGSPITIGDLTNSGTSPTKLTGSQFQSQDGSFSASNFATAIGTGTFNAPLQGYGGDAGTVTNPDGLEAFASGSTAYGVWGVTDAGTGVTGQANTGIGLYAAGTGRIRQDAQAAAGEPNYTPNLMEQARDANGVLWIHNADPIPVWRRVNTLRTDAADNTGNPFVPFRCYDSRGAGGTNPRLPKNSTTPVPVIGSPASTGASTIPPDAIAIVGNLTATAYTGPGYLTIFPTGVALPPTSSVNFITGQGAIANSFVVGLGTGGGVSVYISNNNPSHFIVDITGYIQ
ncbi:MAG TPA: hypothetical protein VFB69_08130 [Candidatus Dormibacteraeota bacterium]|nr:hypothetical protein [Candidatus Dormibacteraeota bacterium]